MYLTKDMIKTKEMLEAEQKHENANRAYVDPKIIKDFKDIIFKKNTKDTRVPKEGELKDEFAKCPADAFTFHYNPEHSNMIRSGIEPMSPGSQASY